MKDATNSRPTGDNPMPPRRVINNEPSQPPRQPVLPRAPYPHTSPPSAPRDLHPDGSATPREALAPIDTDDNARNGPSPRFNNKEQAKHWCLTFNSYTASDEKQIREALMNSNRVVTAIIGKEVGESGNSHLQGYICFTDRVRQSTIHSILGYTTPCMHLSVQGKSGPSQGKPPLADKCKRLLGLPGQR